MDNSLVAIAVVAALSSVAAQANQTQALDPDEVIVITGKKPDQTLSEVAGSMAVATQEQIERHLVSDMNQLFKYDPSIQISGGSGNAQNFIVRGMSGDRILMIKDGMRMNEGYGANGLNDIAGRGFIEMDTLKQVEVAKGAASSLYGADALGGIVVFTTKDPADYLKEHDFYASVKAGYSSVNEQGNLGTTLAFNTGEVGHLVSLTGRNGHQDNNYYQTKSPLDVDSESIFYKGVYHLNPQQQLKLSADLWQQEVVGQKADALAGPFRTLAKWGYVITEESKSNHKENDSYKLSFHDKVDRLLSDQFNLAIYQNNTRQRDVEFVNLDINAPMFGQVGIRDMWANYDYQQKTLGFISNAVNTITSDTITHSIGYGVDIERTDSLRNVHEYRVQNGKVIKDLSSDKFPQNEITRYGLFINDSMDIGEQISVMAGLRWDSYSMEPENGADSEITFAKISEQQLSPNLGIIVNHSKTLSSYAQYAQGFKVPAYDLAYLNHDNSHYGYKIVPTDSLAPERSDSVEIGMRGHVADFAFSAAVFYNDYKDFINIKLIGREDSDDDGVNDVNIFQYHNIDQVTIKGAELNLSYFISDQLSMFLNTAYQDGKDRVTDKYIREISPLSGTFGIDYQAQNWGGEALLRWSDDMRKINSGEVASAGYGVIDLTAFYQVSDQLTLNLALSNILDKAYTPYLDLSGSHTEDFSQVDADYRLNAGREFSINMKYIF